MNKPEGADGDLGLPPADELWPRRKTTASSVDGTETSAQEKPVRSTGSDELDRLATRRSEAAVMKPPPLFPVAPPIPPLSFPVAPSVAAPVESQPVPPVAESTHRETLRTATPPLTETPRPPVSTEAPIASSPATTAHGVQTTHGRSTLGPAVLEQILRSAAETSASTVYVRAGIDVWMRVHGELQVLNGAPVLASDEIELLLVSLKLAHNSDRRQLFVASEWSFDLEGVGHIRCTTFNDHRGAGGMFEIAPFRVRMTDQVGLSLDVQRLASEREGLVIVGGPRGSAKLRLMHQLALLITRSRQAYVIAVQRGMGNRAAHEDASISQREVRDGFEDMLAVTRAALRENPDVLILENARSAPLLSLALDAAASGRLVIAAITAPTALGALERIIDLYPSEQARAIQLLLAQHLRAAVGQLMVPKIRGGFIAAQEVMPMTSAIAAVLSEGRAFQLRSALEAGPTRGMVPLNDALLALVRAGEVKPADAYRRSADPSALLERFGRHGIDTSFASSLASS
jgi:twitching motility protein PilT